MGYYTLLYAIRSPTGGDEQQRGIHGRLRRSRGAGSVDVRGVGFVWEDPGSNDGERGDVGTDYPPSI